MVDALPTFKVNSNNTSVNGTSLKGYITTTYETLTNLLGPSLEGSDDDKTTAEWTLEFDDGTVATIYDWKTGSTPTNLHNWHIGGKTHRAVELVEKALNIKTYFAKF
jgi:hypothetical protein